MTLHPSLWLVLAACSTASGLPPRAHEDELASDMAEGARRFLSSLSPAQATRGRFAFDDTERLDWHFIPRPRPGLALGELTHAPRHLASGFLATAVGRRGLLKASAIMALEEVLHQREHGRGAFVRDAAAYSRARPSCTKTTTRSRTRPRPHGLARAAGRRGDFGLDLLREHYRNHPHGAPR